VGALLGHAEEIGDLDEAHRRSLHPVYESAKNPSDDAKRYETLRVCRQSNAQVNAPLPAKPQVGETSLSGLIIRRSQVQVLPAPPPAVSRAPGYRMGRSLDE
jgi:hypothetical protein